MHYVYVLKNIDNGELYYGYTNNLERRLKEHNKDNEWKLIYFEAYLAESDARQREKKLKQYGQARTHLKNRLKSSISV
ncbi:GIY-YIG nuclease family protein [Candidatus Omnitrophota bacterium]